MSGGKNVPVRAGAARVKDAGLPLKAEEALRVPLTQRVFSGREGRAISFETPGRAGNPQVQIN